MDAGRGQRGFNLYNMQALDTVRLSVISLTGPGSECNYGCTMYLKMTISANTV